MSRYIMRLDDACPRHDRDKWQRMEELLNAYGVKPIVGRAGAGPWLSTAGSTCM